ncbi:unnamed protein product [Lactuca saligna]|uniref:Uncharacterized protein n=1 Tax=Lactuca saligna TaxID=75948 RepID=A0AA35ZEZ2_LACSI|nr:unnamed protein product [Lactuca saligna]
MSMSSSIINHVDQEATNMEVPRAEAEEAADNGAMAFLPNCILNLLDSIRGLLIDYYPQTFGAVDMPPSPISFIITSLYAFAEMKSQGSDFPFTTHPGFVNVALICLILYGLASASEHFISAIFPGSFYAIIVRLVRIGCLCTMVICLASLFCF